MNVFGEVYSVAGIAFVLGASVVPLGTWFEATLNGGVEGQCTATIYTNSLGEYKLVLFLMLAFMPVVSWVFTNGIRRVLRREAPT